MSRFCLPKYTLSVLFITSLLSQTAVAETEKATQHLSGNIGVVSQYVYRGGVENDDPALQGGLEYAFNNGISVGYWGSTLDYDMTDESKDHGIENDLYIAYDHEINQELSYRLQATSYIYHNGGTVYTDSDEKRKTTGFDALAALTYKDLTMSMTVMLADAAFANAGDVYLSAAYSHALPYEFMFNTSIGASIYNSSRDDALMETQKDLAFNEARIGISKEIAKTGLTASVDYVVGGKDRMGEDFDNNTVVGLNYAF